MSLLPARVRHASYKRTVDCQKPGMNRLSQASCFYYQARKWVPDGVNYEEDDLTSCLLGRDSCSGCKHELTPDERNALRKAYMKGFRYDGKKAVGRKKNRAWL